MFGNLRWGQACSRGIVKGGLFAALAMGTSACITPQADEPAEEVEVTAQEIIGGTQATLGELPWQAQISLPGSTHWCGGSIVGTEWVLTAAHCVSGNSPGTFTVRAGLHQRSAPDSHVQTRGVSQIVQHPAYSPVTMKNDVALLRLSAPLTYTSRVQPIAISSTDAAVGTIATVSGWGQTAPGSVMSDLLMKAQLPVRSTLTCNNAGTLPLTVQSDMLCAGHHAGDSGGCHGDDGGPLIVPQGAGWEQIGIASWGVAGSCSSYTVFARLSQFDEWIQSTIAPVFKPLTLDNGWTHAPYSTRGAEVALVSGIVRLKGAIANGSLPEAFVLPSEFRPLLHVYVPVDLCNAKKGRLYIHPNGQVTVQAEEAFSEAQCFTSLEGVSFARTATGFTWLSLQNGWTNAPFSTSEAAAVKLGGIVHLKGAIADGNPGVAFTLPVAFRPAADVYVPLDLCNARKGRLYIQPTGEVTVFAEGGIFYHAHCFTSLDGVTFAQDGSAFTKLSLLNGWTHAPYNTGDAGVAELSGIVRFKGVIANGSQGLAFKLPSQFWPSKNVYVPVDLCDARRGRLLIQPTGEVTVQAEREFFDAQCFTSLDGASFAL